MEGKTFKKILAMLLIIVLTSFQFVYVGSGVALAVYEELEQQSQDTTNKNVNFDAFLEEDSSKVHSKQSSIETGEVIKVQIGIKNGGILNNGKIKIGNEGLTVNKEGLQSEYIKQYNEETGEIELNQIANISQVEITIPVKFNKQDKINVEYFSNETQVLLTGEYKGQNDVSTPVEGKIALRILWTEETEIVLNQNVEKYLQLSDKSIILEQSIETGVVDYKLPKETEKLEIEAPKIEEQYPESVVVLQNGKKSDDYQYDKEIGKISIKYTNTVLEGNNVEWNNCNDVYKVIYHYSKEIGLATRTIELKTNVETKLYTRESIETPAVENVIIEPKGTVNSIKKEMTKDIYKGYLYANVENPTEYKEKITVEVSQTQDEEAITIQNTEDNFQTAEQTKRIANTYFQKIAFEKKQLNRILGDNFSIEILKQDGSNIATIQNNSETEQDGKVYVDIGEEQGNIITIKTNAPIQEGNIEIIANKAISTQNNYTKEQLKTFEKLIANTQIITGNSKIEATSEMELKDTITETKLEINQQSWSTLQNNENIQITATLKSDTIKNDLYKNPVLNIQLPSEVANIEFTSVRKLYADEMEIESIKYYKDRKTIEIIFKGEQTEFKNSINEGIQVVINANIELDKKQPSKESKIIMTTTNENRPNEEMKNEVLIQINSKYGAFLYNSIENFNAQGEKLETVTEETLLGKLDVQTEGKNAKIEAAIINNYENSIQNVCIVGRLPNLEEAIALKSTVFTNLLEKISLENENAKVYYATDFVDINSQGWSEKIENIEAVKMFKIEIPEIQPGQVVVIDYLVGISADLQERQVAYETLNLTYDYNEQNMQTYSNIKLSTPEKQEQNDETQNQENSNMNMLMAQMKEELAGVEMQVNILTPGKEFNDGEDVLEGQNIKYKITLINKTGKDLNNFSLEGTQKDQNGISNVTYWDMKKIEPGVPSSPEVITKYIEDETLTSKRFTKDVFKAGETIEYEYEFTVNSRKSEDEVTIGNLALKADGYQQEKKTMESKIQSAELKLLVTYGQNEEVPLCENNETVFKYQLINISDHDLENVRVEIVLPDGVDRGKIYKGDTQNYKYIRETDNGIIVEIENIEKGKNVEFAYNIYIGTIDKGLLEKSYAFSMNVEQSNSDTIYYSNEIVKTISKSLLEITAVQESSLSGDTIKERQRIQFTTTIKNDSIKDATIEIKDTVPEPFIIEQAYIEKNGQKVLSADINELDIKTEYELKAGEEIKLIVKLRMDYDLKKVKEVENYVTVEIKEYYQTIKTKSIKYKIVEREDNDPEDPEDPIEPENPTDPSGNYGNINGTAWIDANKNGIKDEENGLSGIEVILIDNSTGEIAQNSDKTEMKTKTNESGKYFFTNVAPGNYIVAFKYDSNYYEVTKYQVEGISDDKNSDVISKTISLEGSQMLVAITNEIKSNNNNIQNIDAGFYQRQVFDLSLQKTVGKVIGQTSKRTIQKDFAGQSLAKIEIKSKELVGAKVTVEYKIKVTNEGEISGYAKQIADYLPQGMSFDKTSNEGWKLQDGILYNESLSNVLLEPGESKEITLVLTKTMTNSNTGTVVNTAEISKDYNDLHITDTDSVVGNKKAKEDDMSSAELIISVSTGATTIITTIIIAIIILTTLGIIIYKKKRKGV